MFEKLNYITLSGVKYPIRCDLLVLEKLQDEFGSISDFENKILNWEKKVHPDGKEERTAKLPDIYAVNEALYFMVDEGIEIHNETAEKKMEPVSRKEILRKADISFNTLAAQLHDEFARCFETKNRETTQKTTAEK